MGSVEATASAILDPVIAPIEARFPTVCNG